MTAFKQSKTETTVLEHTLINPEHLHSESSSWARHSRAHNQRHREMYQKLLQNKTQPTLTFRPQAPKYGSSQTKETSYFTSLLLVLEQKTKPAIVCILAHSHSLPYKVTCFLISSHLWVWVSGYQISLC